MLPLLNLFSLFRLFFTIVDSHHAHPFLYDAVMGGTCLWHVPATTNPVEEFSMMGD
jgi:hypothetical protein